MTAEFLHPASLPVVTATKLSLRCRAAGSAFQPPFAEVNFMSSRGSRSKSPNEVALLIFAALMCAVAAGAFTTAFVFWVHGYKSFMGIFWGHEWTALSYRFRWILGSVATAAWFMFFTKGIFFRNARRRLPSGIEP
jgi:hypothetical protein